VPYTGTTTYVSTGDAGAGSFSARRHRKSQCPRNGV